MAQQMPPASQAMSRPVNSGVSACHGNPVISAYMLFRLGFSPPDRATPGFAKLCQNVALICKAGIERDPKILARKAHNDPLACSGLTATFSKNQNQIGNPKSRFADHAVHCLSDSARKAQNRNITTLEYVTKSGHMAKNEKRVGKQTRFHGSSQPPMPPVFAGAGRMGSPRK